MYTNPTMFVVTEMVVNDTALVLVTVVSFLDSTLQQ
jgi:hypothetical protein